MYNDQKFSTSKGAAVDEVGAFSATSGFGASSRATIVGLEASGLGSVIGKVAPVLEGPSLSGSSIKKLRFMSGNFFVNLPIQISNPFRKAS